MEKLMLLLLVPLAWPFIAKAIWRTRINYQEMGLNCVIVTTLVTLVWFLGTYSATQDFEIWNGKVTSKDRDHGHYLRSYQCNCTQTCSGTGKTRSCTQTCQTCYEDRYTVTWSADTTVGDITFDHLDRSSRTVYSTPNPKAYDDCVVGEPASQEKTYTNYVKAVPESLFHDDRVSVNYTEQIPSYPRVYQFYKINRVLNVDSAISKENVDALNTKLNNALKHLGPSKQANIIVILTEIDDPTYRHAVETSWLGGKKNDIVVFIGLDDQTITWTDTMTWALNSGNELFQVTMRDKITELKEFKVDPLSTIIETTVQQKYDRPEMADYEYLKDDIDPPLWVIILCLVVGLCGSLGLTYYFHQNEVRFF